ncbi:hypothetical protein [Kitasatospora sp. NPDC001527]|uniref:hypothetical protein n=1 Tax=Kitasatospora sp. NPDC001527 TaxID=3154519 RepID=UPI003329A5BD
MSVNDYLMPRLLSWSAADPDRNAFAWSRAEEAEVTAEVRALVPSESAPRDRRFAFVTRTTEILVARYGPWACGWHWAVGEGGNGGVVRSWCCDHHSLQGGPDAAAAVVVASLLEWRAWLAELAERFAELAPPAGADAETRRRHVERAAAGLVTLVVERTGAEDAWYALCGTVLTWYLSSAGLAGEEAAELVKASIGGRFHSWNAPPDTTVEAVAEALATGTDGHLRHHDH